MRIIICGGACAIWGVVALFGFTLMPSAHIHAGAPDNTKSVVSKPAYTERLIVKLRDRQQARAKTLAPLQMRSLSAKAGLPLAHLRAMSGDAQVLKLPYRMTVAEAQAIANELSADPTVEYAEPDIVLRALRVPNDPGYSNQWHFQSARAPDNVVGSANLPEAWDITTGSTSIVVAVLDTGLVPHADIDSNILDAPGKVAPGHDFVSADPSGGFFVANDGDGRDADPTDPGDWVTQAEVDDPATPCTEIGDSSWHGTHVAGTIGALSNNVAGVAGVNWTSQILPVRVLGKCGGSSSDLADAIRWAAGIAVTGAPANLKPARVLNISLGGTVPCSSTQSIQSAINDVVSIKNAVVVVAAGNEGGNAANATPASCSGVITVAAVNRSGAKPSYSNFGAAVEIAAPGGSQTSPADSNGIRSTVNSGTTTPAASPGGDSFAYFQGTSMAAPHVAGIVSLMLSANSALTPAEVLTNLQATARTFPTGTSSDCTTSTCGAGIVNAAAALARIAGLGAAPASPVFPATEVSVTTSAQTVTLTNNTGNTITLVNISTSGDFAINNAGTCSGAPLGTVIAAGGSCTVAVTFRPTQLGPRIGTLTVTSDAPNPTLQVPLSSAGTGPTVTVTATDASAAETAAPATDTGTFTFTRTGASTSALTVNYAVSGTATNSVDYANISSTVTIPAGTNPRTATVAIAPVDDSGFEGNESVSLTLTANSNYVIGTPDSATLTIAENDSAPSNGNCFIATAAYGSATAADVRYLRAFRDEYLLTHLAGQWFVNWYYELSPAVADFIRERAALRAAVRIGLRPWVGLSQALVSDEAMQGNTR